MRTHRVFLGDVTFQLPLAQERQLALVARMSVCLERVESGKMTCQLLLVRETTIAQSTLNVNQSINQSIN